MSTVECITALFYEVDEGPTGGTLRYDAIAHISFANKRLGLL